MSRKIDLLIQMGSGNEPRRVPLLVLSLGFSNGSVDTIEVSIEDLVRALKLIPEEESNGQARQPFTAQRSRKSIRALR